MEEFNWIANERNLFATRMISIVKTSIMKIQPAILMKVQQKQP